MPSNKRAAKESTPGFCQMSSARDSELVKVATANLFMALLPTATSQTPLSQLPKAQADAYSRIRQEFGSTAQDGLIKLERRPPLFSAVKDAGLGHAGNQSFNPCGDAVQTCLSKHGKDVRWLLCQDRLKCPQRILDFANGQIDRTYAAGPVKRE